MTLTILSGTNFIMYYSVTFFNGAGISNPFTKSIMINAVNVVSTFPGLFVIEAWGRRRLLILGSMGMAFCQLFMASFASAVGYEMGLVVGKILIAFTALDILFYAATWGPVCWVVTSEIFPLKVRAKAMSFSTASNWIVNFGIAYSTPFLISPQNAALGAKIFFIWGSCNLLAVVFVWCMVYETSKMSLEQIDEMYERVDRAWNSRSFQPTWSFQQMLDNQDGDQSIHTEMEQHNSRTSLSGAGMAAGSGLSTISTNGDSHRDVHNRPRIDENQEIPMASVDFSY